MAITFPEILGDLTDARERYETDGVQFVARWETSVVPAGQPVTAVVYVQNTLDQPVQLTMTPTLGRDARGVHSNTPSKSRLEPGPNRVRKPRGCERVTCS